MQVRKERLACHANESISTASFSRVQVREIASNASSAWGWPVARGTMRLGKFTDSIPMTVHVVLWMVVMGTTTLAGVDLVEKAEVVVMMELAAGIL
jgi:hypothetical protein